MMTTCHLSSHSLVAKILKLFNFNICISLNIVGLAFQVLPLLTEFVSLIFVLHFYFFGKQTSLRRIPSFIPPLFKSMKGKDERKDERMKGKDGKKRWKERMKGMMKGKDERKGWKERWKERVQRKKNEWMNLTLSLTLNLGSYASLIIYLSIHLTIYISIYLSIYPTDQAHSLLMNSHCVWQNMNKKL